MNSMDDIPKKEPKRDKKSIIPHAWHSSKEAPSTPPSDKKEAHRPTRIIASAPPALADKNVDRQKLSPLPVIIATQPKHETTKLTLEEMVQETEHRNPRKNERSKHTISRSLSPAKKEIHKPSPEKLSNSDPGKSFFRKSKEKSPRKKTVSPQKSPKHTSSPTDFASVLNAIRHEKINDIKNFLANPENNPNAQNTSDKNTLLHHAVLTAMAKNNTALVTFFIFNPYINSLLKNQFGYTPHQLIIGQDIADHYALYQLLRSRADLEHMIHSLIISDKELIIEQCDDKIIISKIKALLNRIAEDGLPSYANCAFILTMIKSRLKNDLNILKIVHDFYINNSNHEDEWGDTMLHHYTRIRDKENVKKLVENPNVISKRNKENLFPQGLLGSLEKSVSEIRSMLFNRGSIDSWIEQEVDGLLFANPLVNTLKKDDHCFKKVKKMMKKNFTTVENAQKGDSHEDNDRVLPKDNAQIFAYISDDFLLALFHTHMKIKKDREAFRLTGFNPYPSSTESSDSKEDKKGYTSTSLEKQLLAIEETIMEEIESSNIKPTASDCSLVALDSSSSLTFIDKKS
jgi:hypothetical protein